MHSLDLLLLQEIQIFNILVFFRVILKAVDALTTLLTLEVALLWIALLFGDGSIFLHLAVRSLEALRTGTFSVDVRCIVTA